MGRRPGWENAYLDYENLKLLLSQIEAFYEEEGQRRSTGFFVEEKKRRDYRDELFLESDSDVAYLSVVEEENNRSPPEAFTPNQFTLSYSVEPDSSSEEESRGVDTGCGVAASVCSLSSWTTTAVDVDKRKRNNAVSAPIREDDFYVNTNSNNASGNDAFFLARPEQGPSILSAPVRHTHYAQESSALLPSATQSTPGSSLFTFARQTSDGEPFTPPTKYYFSQTPSKYYGDHPSAASAPNNTSAVPPNSAAKIRNSKKLEQERKEERRHRKHRRERQKRIREQRERNVPRHLRVAHAKARAITERFLGLLRAETEKVMLFAQARLGELADTAGSLRFPSFDDEYGYGSSMQNGGDLNSSHQHHYSYPLADGGMHPSASSSSDEGATGAGQGMYPWSDSSDDEDASHCSQRAGALPKVLSGFSDDTINRNNVSEFSRASPQFDASVFSNSTRKKDMESMAAVRRQIAHFAELRQSRPLFQRNDQILGEDMLFLSAVEEADGYTAVGVELMHVLRYICVNLIAVRKICRKHDRLLMNRMLGGYYQRKRVKEGDNGNFSHDRETLGGFVESMSGGVTEEANPAQRNPYKLIGVYDRKIQLLANSRTVQAISSCLALALSEYEIARSRANAMTRLNSKTSHTSPKRSGGVLPSKLRVHTTESELLQPQLDHDDESSDEAPSTCSSISLTRLQFTVTSIHALREAVRGKQDTYATYLSRSTLAFCGHAIVGEGLDGCSRETLDFLVAYNPVSCRCCRATCVGLLSMFHSLLCSVHAGCRATT
jgi:hypothetical protein